MFKPISNLEDNEATLIEASASVSDDMESDDDEVDTYKKPTDVQTECSYLLESQDQLRQQIEKNGRAVEDNFVSNQAENYELEEDDGVGSSDQIEIEIGSSQIPRISCSNHKLNLAVRNAMSQHGMICSDLKKLNSFISTIRCSYNLDRVFQNSKCRLRLENSTRWGSAFLSIETVIRASLRYAIQKDKLPVSLTRIETYYLILQPSYNLNITFQSNECSIEDVVPSVLSCIETYEDMEETEKAAYAKSLCRLLAKNIRDRFEFELNSDFYKVKEYIN